MSFFERLQAATIGFNGYARLGRDNAGGFGFMALILLFAMTLSCIWSTFQFTNGLGEAADDLAGIPDFSFSNGEVDFREQMPYQVKTPDTLIVIDTTGQTGPDVLDGYSSGMLITKNRVYQIQPTGGIQEIDLSTIPFTLSKDSVISLMRKLWIFIPIAYLFMFAFQLGFKALDACILGLVGLIYGGSTGRRVEFGLAFKLGLYAVTIPTLLQWIVPGWSTIPFGSLKGTMGFLGWWAIAIVYLIMGLQAYYKNQDDPMQGGYYAGNP